MVKNPPANAGEAGLIPGSERCPGRGISNLLPFLPRESDGHKSLVGCSPWAHRESDTAWRVSRQLAVHGCLGDSEPSGQCLTPPGAGPVSNCAQHLPQEALLAHWLFNSALQVKLETCSLQTLLTP